MRIFYLLFKWKNWSKDDSQFASDCRWIPSEKLTDVLTVGELVACSDGTMRYKGEVLNLRPQIKDLCRLFMNHLNRLLTADDIKETIIAAAKRSTTSSNTVAKYVSELHRELAVHYGKSVITNQSKDGWIFEP